MEDISTLKPRRRPSKIEWPLIGEVWYNFTGDFVTKIEGVDFPTKRVTYRWGSTTRDVPLRDFANIYAWRKVADALGRPTSFQPPPSAKIPKTNHRSAKSITKTNHSASGLPTIGSKWLSPTNSLFAVTHANAQYTWLRHGEYTARVYTREVLKEWRPQM